MARKDCDSSEIWNHHGPKDDDVDENPLHERANSSLDYQETTTGVRSSGHTGSRSVVGHATSFEDPEQPIESTGTCDPEISSIAGGNCIIEGAADHATKKDDMYSNAAGVDANREDVVCHNDVAEGSEVPGRVGGRPGLLQMTDLPGGLPAPLPTAEEPDEPAVPGAWPVASRNFDSRGVADAMTAHNGATPSIASEHEGLAVANPVTDEISTPPSAQEMKSPNHDSRNNSVRFGLQILTLVSILVLLAVTILILSLVNRDSDETEIPSTASGAGRSVTAPALSPESLILTSLPEDTISRIMESAENSPQAQAYQWLLNDPSLEEHYLVGDWKITQRFALATFYYATSGQHWKNNTGWLSYDTNECNWFGNSDWEMSFSPRSLAALEKYYTFPDSPCSEVEEYQHLMLSFNKLQGQLPEELYLLTNLRYIYIIANMLSGTLSSSVAKLSKLEALGLSHNQLSGTLPTELGLLTMNKGLFAFTNQFSGSIPTELAQATSLKLLVAEENKLTGTIPSELGRISGLDKLHFETNALTGQLPTQLGLLSTSLTSVELEENSLSGKIPTEIGLLTLLTNLQLNDNLLTGTLPTQLYHLTNVERLYLSNNPLGGGSLSSEIGQLAAMDTLLVANISLTGVVPTEIGLLHQLAHLSLDNNHLTGKVPNELFAMANGNLQEINFAQNPLLTGVIPTHACDMGSKLDFDCPQVCGCDCPCVDTGG